MDVHIRTLRQKLGDKGDLIETVRGVVIGSEELHEKKDSAQHASVSGITLYFSYLFFTRSVIIRQWIC